MPANVKNALSAYGQSSIEQDVEHASPHKLICLLYEGAIKALFMAKMHMQNHEIGPKGLAISKAIAIIEEGLRNSLDAEKSGDIAANLDTLYDYMSRRLLEANFHNDVNALDEVQLLLSQLKESWESIDKTTEANKPAEEPPETGRQPLSYGRV
ncbi:flagellar export chaperone FliS [Chitinimonas sp. BJB300]|uniref:flagellar export chaperone FliS n=1 Tax=Chitinimonas sp. BJB300 TaxID=1559339 RepID=UPI000C0FB349|nr:flagellar export chaperone FliS [Chitinimonas sp. BJB300]PHV12475.1 flagellar export chaperone FliS [Chitinimonas sp. BJB300]TSJ89136.1 flagellar export chaperone FliS [Chitinimonas sp. BJB300]